MLESSAFSHDYFEGFNWTDCAYRRYKKVPFVPTADCDPDVLEDDDSINQPFPTQCQSFDGDQSLFKDF